MDNLKQINDTLGHAEGDAAINEIAVYSGKPFANPI
jgi:GGDEF domain-containing protein